MERQLRRDVIPKSCSSADSLALTHRSSQVLLQSFNVPWDDAGQSALLTATAQRQREEKPTWAVPPQRQREMKETPCGKCTSYLAALSPCDSCLQRKLLMIVVMSAAGMKFTKRRFMMRHMYRTINIVHAVDYWFVMGRPSVDDVKRISLEQAVHGDLMVLDMKENMNEGKTFAFFKSVADMAAVRGGRIYDFVAKGDDDTFVHITVLGG